MTDVFQQEVLSGDWSIRKQRDGIVRMMLVKTAGAPPMLDCKLDRTDAVNLVLDLLDALEVNSTLYEEVQGVLS